MENEKKSKNKIAILILMVIIIILLILIFLLLQEGLLNNEKLIPTGNVDIFEINCDQNCNCNNNNDDENNNVNSDSNSNTTTTTNNNDSLTSGNNYKNSDTPQNNGDIKIYDKDVIWQSTNKLRIFENPVYQMDSIIAPLSTNSYQFIIKNSTIYNVKYNLKFQETNNYDINMKYRLKKNGSYIAGNQNEWVSYEKLNLSINNIKVSEKDTYYLEWKWFEDDNDTAIGSINSKYTLSITLAAEQAI